MDFERFDEERLEWEFQALQKEHRQCCTGALLWLVNGDDRPQWMNVCAPVSGPGYRPWEAE